MSHSKILRELMRITGRGAGPMTVATIDLSASTSDADLIAAPTGKRIYVEQVDLILAGASTFDLWSGASADADRCIGGPGTVTGAASAQYTFGPFYTEVDGDALVIDRGTSVAVSGAVRYCVV